MQFDEQLTLPLSESRKICRDCLAALPLDSFPPAKKRSDGRASYCRPCMTVRSRASYRKRAAEQGRTVREPEALPPGVRRCPDCQTIKPENAFPRRGGGRTGPGAYCYPCQNLRIEASRVALHGSTRNYHLKHRYGLTEAEVDAMIEAQGGLCALCQERPAEHVDHCHLTGKIRGVLCSCCNQGLGNFRDRADTLRRAITYLETTTWQKTRVCTGVYRLTSPRPAVPRSSTSSPWRRPTSSRRGAGTCPPG